MAEKGKEGCHCIIYHVPYKNNERGWSLLKATEFAPKAYVQLLLKIPLRRFNRWVC